MNRISLLSIVFNAFDTVVERCLKRALHNGCLGDFHSSYIGRIQLSHFWVVRDDKYFTNKEYNDLMDSYLREQSFEPSAPWSAPEDEQMSDVIDGKDDYFATDYKYSGSDNSSPEER